jgi:hypothetical protein
MSFAAITRLAEGLCLNALLALKVEIIMIFKPGTHSIHYDSRGLLEYTTTEIKRRE